MFRFTIRDVVWLMMVAALTAAWWVDHRMAATWRDRVTNGIQKARREFETNYGMFLDWNEADGSLSISRK